MAAPPTPHSAQKQVAALEDAAPRLASGIELVGEYENSGFKEPLFIARDDDGQIIQLPQWLYAVAEELDGERDLDEIAARVSARLGRGFSADDVEYLIEQRLRPLGVLAQPDGSRPEFAKPDPLLGLKFRTAVVPKRLVRALTSVFYPCFLPPVIAAALAGFVAVDAWLFFVHGVAQAAREIAYNPILLVLVFGLVVLATALHEVGHATAARYGGAEPGAMGVGVYIVWPAFYTDVTDSYRLGRRGRLRTDLGGVYFNVLFILGVAGAYALTGFEPLLVLIVIQHVQIVQQLMPFLRLDGYYILSDLTGVPDLFARIKPALKSAVPGAERDPRVEELKPWVRIVTTTWVVLLVPVLLFIFGTIIFNLPRMAATAWDSLLVQLERISSGGGFEIAAGAIQTAALVLPLAGFTYMLTQTAKRLGTASWRWSEDAPARRALVVAVGVTLAAVAGYVLQPNGDYRPIQPDERGTLVGAVRQFGDVLTGRPGLTEERERELGRAVPGAGPNGPVPVRRSEREAPSRRDRLGTTGSVARPSRPAVEPARVEPPAVVTLPGDRPVVTSPPVPPVTATAETPLVSTAATVTVPTLTATSPTLPIPTTTVTIPAAPPLPELP